MATHILEPGLIKGSVVLQEEEVINKIGQLLQSPGGLRKESGNFRFQWTSVIPSLLFAAAPKAMLPEARSPGSPESVASAAGQLYLLENYPRAEGKEPRYT